MTAREWFRVMRGAEVAELLGSHVFRGGAALSTLPMRWTIFDTMKVVDRETRAHYTTPLTWDALFLSPSFQRVLIEDLARPFRRPFFDDFYLRAFGEFAPPCRRCAEKDAEIAELRKQLTAQRERFIQHMTSPRKPIL